MPSEAIRSKLIEELTSRSRDGDLGLQLADGIPCAAFDDDLMSWPERNDIVLDRVARVVCQRDLLASVLREEPAKSDRNRILLKYILEHDAAPRLST